MIQLLGGVATYIMCGNLQDHVKVRQLFSLTSLSNLDTNLGEKMFGMVLVGNNTTSIKSQRHTFLFKILHQHRPHQYRPDQNYPHHHFYRNHLQVLSIFSKLLALLAVVDCILLLVFLVDSGLPTLVLRTLS